MAVKNGKVKKSINGSIKYESGKVESSKVIKTRRLWLIIFCYCDNLVIPMESRLPLYFCLVKCWDEYLTLICAGRYYIYMIIIKIILDDQKNYCYLVCGVFFETIYLPEAKPIFCIMVFYKQVIKVIDESLVKRQGITIWLSAKMALKYRQI